jgi:restriction endonuclease S subunit
VRRGEISSRFDVGSGLPILNYWHESIEQQGIPPVKIGELIHNIRYGTGSPPPKVEPSLESVPFLRATDIKDGQILLENLPHIHCKQPNRMKKCQLYGGELIIVRSGVNTGDCAVVPAQLSGAYAAYDLIVETKKKVLPEFICACFYTKFGKAQINAVKNRAAQPHINAEEVKSFEIPLIDLKIQRRLVAELDAARAERDRALAEAEQLLLSIDNIVKISLGLPELTPPQYSGYAIHLKVARQSRTMAADYFHPERMLAIKAIQRLVNAPLALVVNFKRNIAKVTPGDKYIGLASITTNTGQLTGVIETASGQCFEFEKGDVLYGRLRPYLNKVWFAQFSGVCSTEFHVMRPMNEKELLPKYLAVAMRTSLIVAQTKHMMTGNTHPRLANEDVANLLIPLAHRKIQNRIVDETAELQAASISLRSNAEIIWQQARTRFEEQLMHGVQS